MRHSPALSRPVALAKRGRAHGRLGLDAVRADAGLRVHAPEAGVAGALRAGIGLGADELSLPAQSRAQVRMLHVEARIAGVHASPLHIPAAFRMARFTATRVSWILYSFLPSPFALLTAAFPAASAVSSVTDLPTSACAASSDIHGIGATLPS